VIVNVVNVLKVNIYLLINVWIHVLNMQKQKVTSVFPMKIMLVKLIKVKLMEYVNNVTQQNLVSLVIML
jgi:hypothetical protein